jgi:hypothetical protein
VCPRRGRVHESRPGGSYRVTNVWCGMYSRLDGRGIARAIGLAQDMNLKNDGPPHHRAPGLPRQKCRACSLAPQCMAFNAFAPRGKGQSATNHPARRVASDFSAKHIVCGGRESGICARIFNGLAPARIFNGLAPQRAAPARSSVYLREGQLSQVALASRVTRCRSAVSRATNVPGAAVAEPSGLVTVRSARTIVTRAGSGRRPCRCARSCRRICGARA